MKGRNREQIHVALGLFPSERPLPALRAWRYQAKAVGPVPQNLYSFGARAARKAKRSNRVTVVSRKLDLFATARLPNVEVWDEAKIVEIGPIVLDPMRDASLIERIIDEVLAASIPRDQYAYGFDYARERRVHRTNATGAIELYRGFRLQPRVLEDGRAALMVDLKHTIVSRETLDAFLARGEEVDGLHVAHVYDGNTATVVGLSAHAVSDPVEDLGNKSLLEHHFEEGNLPSGLGVDPETRAVLVQYGDRVYPHIPALLRPVMSLDAIKEEDPSFAILVSGEIHRTIRDRFALAGAFIRSLRPLQIFNVQFRTEPGLAHELGYEIGLTNGANPEFRDGFTASFPAKGLRQAGLYRAPQRVCAGILFPEGQEERAELFWETLAALMHDAFDIEMQRGPRKSYHLTDSLGFKDAAASYRGADVDIVLAIIPSARVARGEEDSNDPYNPFKRAFARVGIPSQMVSTMNVADPDMLLNLALGVVVKCGGIPWRVKHIPGRPECFVGLDISHRDGVHLAASAHLFDADGTYIGWNCVTAQKGETIAERDLMDAIEDVLLAFKERHDRLPRTLVLHRDGRFTEEAEGLVRLFHDHNIQYDFVEVKKSGAPRMGVARDGTYFTPNKGTYVVRGDTAYLCTTGEREYKIGSPRPVTIRRVRGGTNVATLAEQAYWLSEMHVGSTHSTRLPITTHYADKCSTLAQYGLLPTGKIENRLYFV